MEISVMYLVTILCNFCFCGDGTLLCSDMDLSFLNRGTNFLEYGHVTFENVRFTPETTINCALFTPDTLVEFPDTKCSVIENHLKGSCDEFKKWLVCLSDSEEQSQVAATTTAGWADNATLDETPPPKVPLFFQNDTQQLPDKNETQSTVAPLEPPPMYNSEHKVKVGLTVAVSIGGFLTISGCLFYCYKRCFGQQPQQVEPETLQMRQLTRPPIHPIDNPLVRQPAHTDFLRACMLHPPSASSALPDDLSSDEEDTLFDKYEHKKML